MGAWVDRDPLLSRLHLPADGPYVSLVGGAVRDAILGVTHGVDIDAVVEGDAIALAQVVGRSLGGRVVTHERFGTARVEFAHGRHLDLVSARRERYPAPGALPEVVPGTLEDDLARRDFTVNAIAFRLSGPGAGLLVDPHGGRDDIAAERLRALRPGSFTEDPSRAVRALRYAARLGFRMEGATEHEARECVGTLDLRSSRVGDELRRLLDEDSADAALVMAAALGAAWPDPDARRGDRLAAIAPSLGRPGAPEPPVWALRLGLGLTPAAAQAAAVPQWARAIAAEARAGLALGAVVARAQTPSRVDVLLRGRPAAEQVGALIAGAGDVARWWAEWRDVRPLISGGDLVAAGVPAGPAMGRGLAAARASLLDGEADSRDAQLAVAVAAAGRS